MRKLVASGSTIADGSTALAGFQASEIEKYRRIVQQANIRL